MVPQEHCYENRTIIKHSFHKANHELLSPRSLPQAWTISDASDAHGILLATTVEPLYSEHAL